MGQLGLHSAMAGLRMAAPLQALREGYGAAEVGVLLALFAAAPVMLALPAGRLADRWGYHRPVALAVALAMLGALAAVVCTFWEGTVHFALLCASAALTGTAANNGMMAIHRAAARLATDGTERVRLFSWLGVAPSLANVVGPVAAGFAIDQGGFVSAYALLLAMPLLSLWSMRKVPRSVAQPVASTDGAPSSWELLQRPGFKRLLSVNWLMSSCWDAHTFAVPILGHQLGFSASVIGLILGAFTGSVSFIRLVIPLVASRLNERQVLRAAMVGTGVVLLIYPWATEAWQMAVLALVLGVTLGCTQPMVMVMLHHVSPADRFGEALAVRSMVINLSSTTMPLMFGIAGVALGVTALFVTMGASVMAGSLLARRLQVPPRQPHS